MQSDLVVETGSGSITANSYQSVAGADLYQEDHNDPVATTWSGATTLRKETALRNATQYLDAVYGVSWLGTRSNKTQRLNWPRRNITDRDDFLIASTTMPRELLEATSILAHLDITETNGLRPNLAVGKGNIKQEMKKVAVLEKDVTYAGRKLEYTRYSLVENLLSSITRGSNKIERE